MPFEVTTGDPDEGPKAKVLLATSVRTGLAGLDPLNWSARRRPPLPL